MTAFFDLHVPGRPFVLVNGWDVASVLLLARAGHPAVGTTSLGVTAAAGELDGARAGLPLTVELVRRLAGRLDVPLTVDLEDGYSSSPSSVAALVAELASYGVAGVNLEDAGRPPSELAAVVRAVKEAAPAVFVNARNDEFWSGSRSLPAALEALRAYRDAGADGLFLPGADLSSLAEAVALGPPVNALWQPGVDLASAGVARISTGSAPYRYALGAALAAARAASTGSAVPVEAVPYADVQEVIRPRG